MCRNATRYQAQCPCLHCLTSPTAPQALGIFDVFVTNDNGENWRIVKEGTDAVIAQGAFTAGSEFIAVGEVPTFGNQTEQSGLLSSKDGGRTWQFTNLTDVSSTLPRYGGAAGDTWVISGGSFPGVSAELPKGSRRLNRRVIASGTGKGASGFKFADATMLSAVASDDDAGWSAELLVSKDAGKTWASKYHSEGDFYFNEVSCGSQDNCCAVGEADQGARPGARIWCTADGGEQWTENMFIGNYTYSLTGMEFVTPTEAWASGGIFGDIGPLEALFFHTVDAGKTWQQMRFGGLEGLDVYSMTFPSGDSTSGHAVGLTALQETSELVFQ